MNLNSDEIHRLNIKSCPYGITFGVVVAALLLGWGTSDINSPRKHSRNARVISAEELGTMSKNNLRGITLDIGPILGIHSLTLIISCSHTLQH